MKISLKKFKINYHNMTSFIIKSLFLDFYPKEVVEIFLNTLNYNEETNTYLSEYVLSSMLAL